LGIYSHRNLRDVGTVDPASGSEDSFRWIGMLPLEPPAFGIASAVQAVNGVAWSSDTKSG
jgi:hypothetical protein